MKRSGIFTKVIIFALVTYAVFNLISIRGRIEATREEVGIVRRAVAELERSNAELEYEIENYGDPDVIAAIARARLGLILPGEIVFFDGGNGNSTFD